MALLTAFDEGLGACLNTPNPPLVKRVFDVPDEWIPLWVLLAGYPAESWEAGGQRPRPPFEELFFEGEPGTPFKREEKVVERLKEAQAGNAVHSFLIHNGIFLQSGLQT